jgi:hypothetical protein
VPRTCVLERVRGLDPQTRTCALKRSNERPEGVRVSKVSGCRGLVGIEGEVEGVGVEALRVHGHERTHSCVLKLGVRCYIINGQKCGTHLDHTSSSSLALSSSSLMLMKFRWRTGAASTGGWDNAEGARKRE